MANPYQQMGLAAGAIRIKDTHAVSLINPKWTNRDYDLDYIFIHFLLVCIEYRKTKF